MNSKSSSDNDCSLSSNSSEESHPSQSARAKVHTPKKRKAVAQTESNNAKRHKKSDKSDELRKLAEQVNNIENLLSRGMLPQTAFYNCSYPMPLPVNNDDVVSLNVSNELFSDNECNDIDEPKSVKNDSSVNLSINTVLKEPSLPKSSKFHLELLQKVQHFDSSEWRDVRYSEVQKAYSTTPGFVELECNDEIKPFDRYTNFCVTERSYAAITQALINQKDAAQAGFESLLTWASDNSNDLSPTTIKDKLNEIFIEGSYNKISNHLLQLACGHRADIIEQRRDSILRSVKDKFLRSKLRNIPPTSSFLFKNDAFSDAIEKSGGVGKAFWPIRNSSQKSNWTAAQAGTSNTKTPAQGFQFNGPKGPYGRFTQSQPMQNIYPYGYQPFYAPPGGSSFTNYYPTIPTQGNNYQAHSNRRFAQNHYKLRPNSSRNNQQRSNLDDSVIKSHSKPNNKNFRFKRKF